MYQILQMKGKFSARPFVGWFEVEAANSSFQHQTTPVEEVFIHKEEAEFINREENSEERQRTQLPAPIRAWFINKKWPTL
jgi:hypothetical protein